MAATGPAGAAQGRGHRSRGDGCDRRPGGPLPGAAAARALRGDEPLGRVRPQPVPAPGPQGQRHAPGPDPRGDVHPAGEGPVLLVQGPAPGAVPDPDQVPRRGPPARRTAARPRVRDEGLLLLRHRRRRPPGRVRQAPRGVHPDLRPARAGLRDRAGDVRRDGRLGLRGVLGRRRERRGHLRTVPGRLRRERRGGADRGPRAAGVRRRARRTRGGHPGLEHDRGTAAGRQRPAPPRRPTLGRCRHAEERRVHGRAARRDTGAAGDRPARRPRGGREAPGGAARAGHRGALRRRGLREVPQPGQGLHRSGRAGGEEHLGHQVPRRPPRGRGHPLDHRRRCRPAARLRPGLWPRLHPGWCRRRRRDPGGRSLAGWQWAAGAGPGHRDGAHLPARPQVRRGARPEGARPERQAGHRHDGLLRNRRVPGGRRGGRDHL